MTLLETRDLAVHFRGGDVVAPTAGPTPDVVRAVDGVSLAVDRGTTVGLVGESGSGKSTLARAILGLIPVSGGEVLFDGESVGGMGRLPLRRFRRRAQLVFQDPAASMHPRLTVGEMLDEAISVARGLRGPAVAARRRELLDRVGLSPSQVSDALPHQVSGGQRQRACIARALAVEPELLVLDEPTSALDVSVQASVVNLLMELQAEFHLTSLFISHDLALVRLLAGRVIILHEGRIVEEGKTEAVLSAPSHERTRRLLNASLQEGVG